MAAGQAKDEVLVRDSMWQGIEALRRLENVLGVVGHADHLPGVEAYGADEPQSKEAVVGHSAHHAADVDRVSRFDQHDGHSVEPLRRTPTVGRGFERERFIAAADRILWFSALEARGSVGQASQIETRGREGYPADQHGLPA